FLDLSRLERGEAPPLRLAGVAVGPALTAAVELLGGPQRATRVIIDCGPEVTGVRADPHALERILMNLLSNALKYSPAHSAVTMRAHAASGKVVISVEDAGRGIAPDALPRVFEPTARAAIRHVLLDNLQAEERLEADARQILLEHAKAIKDSAADYRQLFPKVKEKLARDRGFIL